MRIATAGVRTGFAMTWFFARGAVRGRAGDRKGRPYGGVGSAKNDRPGGTVVFY